MIEVEGDLWRYKADFRVITTNGTVKKDGSAVMGRGYAKEAKAKNPELPRLIGYRLKHFGNKVGFIHGGDSLSLYIFPVKHEWWQRADLELIKQSAKELAQIAKILSHYTFVLPRPGCGNGKLKWEDVKEVIGPILPDNVHVITFPKVEGVDECPSFL